MTEAFKQAVRAGWSDRRGISALEFGLIAPVMATLVLSAVDLGNAMQETILLQQAVRAGGQYALAFPSNTAGIKTTISGAIPSAWNANIPTVSAVTYACVNTTTGAATANPTDATCPSGSIPTQTITLGISMTYSALLWTSIGTLSASYVVRYQ